MSLLFFTLAIGIMLYDMWHDYQIKNAEKWVLTFWALGIVGVFIDIVLAAIFIFRT